MTKLVRNHAHWGAFLAEVEDGRVVGVRPFEHDPDPSPMIQAVPAAVHSQTRIAQPMVREGWLKHGRGHSRGHSPGLGEGRGREPFVPVSWERALDLVAGELMRIKSDHGHDAIMAGSQGWGSAGIFHEARAQLRRFMSTFGGFIDQTSNYSFGTALTFLPHVVGSAQPVTGPLTSWSSIARHAKLMVLFGGCNPKNMQVTKGGCAGHFNGDRLAELVRNGVDVVTISPNREDGPAGTAPEWIAIRPGSDTAMLLALVHTLVANRLHDADFLARYCTGFERVRAYVMGETDGQPKDADWAAPLTTVPADTIRSLARRMAANRTMITASWSLQRADHGEQPFGASFCWRRVSARSDFRAAVSASVMAPRPALPSRRSPSTPRQWRSWPIRSVAPFRRRASPSACCTRARVTTSTAERVLIPTSSWCIGRAAIHSTIIRTPTSCAPDFGVRKPSSCTSRGGQRPRAMRTSCYRRRRRSSATILAGRRATGSLSPCSRRLSRWARREMTIQFSARWRANSAAKASTPKAATRWPGCATSTMAGATASAPTRRPFRISTSSGRTVTWKSRSAREEYVLHADFRADPEKHKLGTPSGRIELYSDKIAGFGYDNCPPHTTWIEPSEWLGASSDYPLHLVSSQPRYRLHSQMDAGPVSARGKVAGREAVAIHPDDAQKRGIKDGDVVRIYNSRGACLAGAVVIDTMLPGVVKLSCGAWYDPAGAEDGAVCVHGNANVLTHDRGTSKLSQGPSSGTNMVEIERWQKPLPPVRAFEPPEVAGIS